MPHNGTPLVEWTCAHCGLVRMLPSYKARKHTFCSYACTQAVRKSVLPRACAWCGTEFVNHSKNRKHCSRACKSAAERAARPARFWSKVDTSGGPDACWPWMGGRHANGYGQCGHRDGEKLAHRYAWIQTNGPIPDDLLIRHTCDNPPCCNPAHLEPGTQLDNRRDAVERGRTHKGERGIRQGLRGEASPNAKLTWEIVRAIRARHEETGEGCRRLQRAFPQVDRTTIDRILANKTWRE